MRIYTEKQLQKEIDERMARQREHDWTVEHFDRNDKRLWMLEEKVRKLEDALKVEEVPLCQK